MCLWGLVCCFKGYMHLCHKEIFSSNGLHFMSSVICWNMTRKPRYIGDIYSMFFLFFFCEDHKPQSEIWCCLWTLWTTYCCCPTKWGPTSGLVSYLLEIVVIEIDKKYEVVMEKQFIGLCKWTWFLFYSVFVAISTTMKLGFIRKCISCGCHIHLGESSVGMCDPGNRKK